MSDEQQTQQADDPSGPGWRDVEPDELLQPGDMYVIWHPTTNAGAQARQCGTAYRRRIEPQQQAETNPDDPSGDGWRDLGPKEPIEQGDVFIDPGGGWMESDAIGRTPSKFPNLRHRRRIEPQQPSDSEPETIDSWEMRLAKMTQWNLELEALVAEAERGSEQVNAELQQLREQVQTLTQERDRLQSWLQQHHTTGQQSAIKKLERWLKPVLKVVADHPDHSSILAAAVLEFLPQIASRLIEE